MSNVTQKINLDWGTVIEYIIYILMIGIIIVLWYLLFYNIFVELSKFPPLLDFVFGRINVFGILNYPF